MRRATAVPALLSVLALAAPALAQGLLVCYPGQAGDTKAAQPVMDALAKALTQRSSVAVTAIYYNAAEPAKKWMEENKPNFGILSLSCYLRWKKAGVQMTPIASGTRAGRTTLKYHVVVNKLDKAAGLADLKGRTVESNHVDDEKFATAVVFDGAAEAKDLKLRFTKSAFSALKACAGLANRAVDAVLLDDDQLAALDELKEVKEAVKVVFSSKDLPLAPVVAFGGAAEEDREKVKKAFLALGQDEEGKKLLTELQSSGFRDPELEAYAAAEKAYAR